VIRAERPHVIGLAGAADSGDGCARGLRRLS
jgi:hypothetical protein